MPLAASRDGGKKGFSRPRPTRMGARHQPSEQSPPLWGSSFFSHTPLLPQDSPGSRATKSWQGFWIVAMVSLLGSGQHQQLISQASGQ